MATYYVGPGGNNANNGLTWALRKLSLNGAEDIPVQAGDTVYVGPGTYREMLTVDVSGSAGSPIAYIGDYTGANTDGVGGVVRITGSDNDQAAARNSCISMSSKMYRIFRSFSIDTCAQYAITGTDCADIELDKIIIQGDYNYAVLQSVGTSQARWTITNCFGFSATSSPFVQFYAASAANNVGHSVSNCVMVGHGGSLVQSRAVGGITVKNSTAIGGLYGINVSAALTAGQTVTVNNCIFYLCQVAFAATATGEITENYNTLYGNATARTNTNIGANTKTYPPLFDTRWFFEAVNGGDMVTPFDLASYSQLVNMAGTSPTATDMRGTAVQGTQREWGALEYDPALLIEAGSGGGAVSISPYRGNIG